MVSELAERVGYDMPAELDLYMTAIKASLIVQVASVIGSVLLTWRGVIKFQKRKTEDKR